MSVLVNEILGYYIQDKYLRITLSIAILSLVSVVIGSIQQYVNRVKIDNESIIKDSNGNLTVDLIDGGDL